jgi:uncharacterized protein (TIGR03435 family)
MLTAVAAFAQNQPQFDVVSIKPNNTVPNIMETPPLNGGRLNFMHASLKTMIGIAYKVKSFQIEGAPAWAGTDRYDISATSTELSPSEERYRSMLRNMLEDRFQLSAHRESRESTIYGLVAAKNGSKLKAAAPGNCVPLDAEHPSAAPGQRCGSANIMANRLTGTSMTTAGLADVLTNIAGRPVVDKTGISGMYDIHLEFTRAESAVDNDAAGPSIFTALQEQLGLRLESQKGPVEFLVVDHAEKPSAN